MDVFEILRKTLSALLLEAENAGNPLQTLCDVAGLINTDVLSTAIRLMETQKVRQLNMKITEKFRKKPRKFEEFTEKTVFNNDTEISILKRNRRKSGIIQLECPLFVEVEHPKRKEMLQFIYPKVHFCSCKYFQIAVLDRQNEWICLHLVASYLSNIFGKLEILDCNSEISAILRKILIRAVHGKAKKRVRKPN